MGVVPEGDFALVQPEVVGEARPRTVPVLDGGDLEAVGLGLSVLVGDPVEGDDLLDGSRLGDDPDRGDVLGEVGGRAAG